VDCGKNACNKFCPATNAGKEKAQCDRTEDCMGDCKSGKCSFQPCSCTEIYNTNKGMKSGLYTIFVDKKWHARNNRGDNDITGSGFEVYCDVDYDKSNTFPGVYTLVQTVAANQHWDNYYQNRDRDTDYNPKMGAKWAQAKTGTNYASRFGLEKWNSIFKHSLGIVMTRYANHRAGYQLTDVFATPEKGQHIFDKDHSCSGRDKLDIAHAYRNGGKGNQAGSMGYCFNNGALRQKNACICGDAFDSNFNFNRCAGQHGNMRRYNSYLNDNRRCSGMHTKCHGYSNHGNLGDSYSCDKPGQRGVGGHMWMSYHGSGGMPGWNVGHYGYYGSRWIK